MFDLAGIDFPWLAVRATEFIRNRPTYAKKGHPERDGSRPVAIANLQAAVPHLGNSRPISASGHYCSPRFSRAGVAKIECPWFDGLMRQGGMAMSRVGNLPSPLHRGEKNDEMTRLKQFLLPVVVAIGFGPLMAGLGVSLVAIATSLLDPAKTLRITESWPMFGVYIGFAYLVGAPIALMAGILVSVWMIWRPPSLMVAIAAAIVATSCYAAVAALGVLGPVEQTNARSNFRFTIVIAAIAAAACWLLIRRFADNFPRQVRELKQAPRTIARPKTIVFQNCNNNR